MASFLSHIVVASTLGNTYPSLRIQWKLILIGSILSVIPDLDTIGFKFGIPYESLWGHRGITHSIFFAVIISLITTLLFFRKENNKKKTLIFIYLFAMTMSHAILDAFTNGGMGIAFFAPFDSTRYFFPFNPVEVSPIYGTDLDAHWAVKILISEFLWIILPSILVIGITAIIKRIKAKPGL